MSPRVLRCAIYTRKSSEEGLEQSFNSLDAQREACTAYVQSQLHEGWKVLPELYDDGGFSGGNMDRPALKKLLADIDAGCIDLVVVYKVDRLTRALTDFAKIVERFDARNVSFVSVTQSFNTTTSMGRLTLNVLLSFAQFEREVTGERIRDKIAASKRKGMWMGGVVPLGYDVCDRQLVINEEEAIRVRHIFEQYVRLKNVDALHRQLKKSGYRSKVRTVNGKSISYVLSNGALTRILTNPLYRGVVHHRGEDHAGKHSAIVTDELWKQVQAILVTRQRANSVVPRARGRNPLLGLLTDDQDRSFYASYTVKPGHLPYRYYVTKPTEPDEKRFRLPAEELETHVSAAISGYLHNPQKVLDDLSTGTKANDLRASLALLKKLAKLTEEERWSAWRPILKSVIYSDSRLVIGLDKAGLCAAVQLDLDREGIVKFEYSMRLHRTGHDLRLVIPSATANPEAAKRNPSLIKFVAQGRKWYRLLTSGRETSLKAIAKTEGVTDRYIARVLRGSLLAPDIIQRILDGRQPVTLTVQTLMRSFPSDWVEQRKHFGV